MHDGQLSMSGVAEDTTNKTYTRLEVENTTLFKDVESGRWRGYCARLARIIPSKDHVKVPPRRGCWKYCLFWQVKQREVHH